MAGNTVATRSNNVILEDVYIIPGFRNFAGKEGQYNREGDRNFSIMLDPVTADEMAADGWNVKYLKVREEGDEPQPYLQVSVSYKNRPPTIVQITSRGKTFMTEEVLEALDWVDILKADLILNPYSWSVSGKSGIKAYLRSAYITIDEDPLALKYADVADASDVPALEAYDIIEGEIIEDQRAIGG